MKRKKLIPLLLGLILIAAVVLYFCRDSSSMTLDAEKVTSVRFSIYPQCESNYTVSDPDRVQEIVHTINELDMQKGTDHVNRMSDNYYYFFIHMSDAYDVAIELDETIISLNHTIYKADTSDLRALLEQTYNDVMQGKID